MHLPVPERRMHADTCTCKKPSSDRLACCPIYLRLHVLVLDDGFSANGGTSSAGNDGEG